MAHHEKDIHNELYSDSFEALFSRYARGLVVYAREFLPSGEEAEDMVHDVFVSLWDKMDSLSVDTAKAYLFRATRNRCLDYLSHLKVKSRYQESILKEKDLSGVQDIDLYVETELKSYIESAIDCLPPQRKKIFRMNKMEGMPAHEIAVELNLSQRTVEKHIELAMKAMKSALLQYLSLLLALVADKF